MKDRIGQLAGRVWRFLGAQGEVEEERLARKMKLKAKDAYQGLGWLAREDKVRYETKGGKIVVSLTEAEQAAYESEARS